MPARKGVTELLNALEAQSFGWRLTSKNHYQIWKWIEDPKAPGGRRKGPIVAVMASTPSDHRAGRNSLADLTRAGFVWRKR